MAIDSPPSSLASSTLPSVLEESSTLYTSVLPEQVMCSSTVSTPISLDPPDSATQSTPLKGSSYLSKSFTTALERRNKRLLRRKLTLPISGSYDFSSNDFLSLSRSNVFRERFLGYLTNAENVRESAQQSDCHPQGLASGGSRLLDGNSRFAEDLERFIARFHDAESALLFNSGYDANVGVFSTIPQPGDVIVYDDLVHASIHDGMRLSRASRCVPFPHNSPDGLRQTLKKLVEQKEVGHDELTAEVQQRNVFVAVESVYSMDGDIAPIDKFADVLEEVFPRGNGYLMVDEAHATGVFGPKGSGVVQSLGQQRRVLTRVHTFGKALASHGAVVLCSPLTREYLINYARSLIYTTALPFAALASIRTAYELLDSGECDKLRANLDFLIEHCRKSLLAIGIPDTPPPSPSSLASSLSSITSKNTSTTTSLTSLPNPISNPIPTPTPQPKTTPNPTTFTLSLSHNPSSPIFSLLTPSALDLAAFCQARGYMVRAVRPPTVPRGTERVRVCLHAGNTRGEVEGLVGCVGDWMGREGMKVPEVPEVPKARGEEGEEGKGREEKEEVVKAKL